MTDDKREHVLTFESDDFYAGEKKLEIDCRDMVTISVDATGSNMSAGVTFHLIGPEDVQKVIQELTDWVERYRARVGR